MAVGAVTGALHGAKAANKAELTGLDFATVVGLGALTGGLEGTVLGIGAGAKYFVTSLMIGRPKFSLAGILGFTTVDLFPNILANIDKEALQKWVVDHIPQWQVEETVIAIAKNPYTTMITQYGLAPGLFYIAGFEL